MHFKLKTRNYVYLFALINQTWEYEQCVGTCMAGGRVLIIFCVMYNNLTKNKFNDKINKHKMNRQSSKAIGKTCIHKPTIIILYSKN